MSVAEAVRQMMFDSEIALARWLYARSPLLGKAAVGGLARGARLLPRRRPGRSIVRATCWGRPLWMHSDHRLPQILLDNPQFGEPLALLVESLQSPRVRVIDVGANIGDSVALIESVAPGRSDYLCVEADDDYCDLLRRNVGGLDTVTIEQCFLSDQPGQRLSTQHHVPGTALSLETSDRTAPAARTLDDVAAAFVRKHGHVDVLKIDTDGFDSKILRSSAQLLERHHPALLFELHPYLWRQAREDPVGVFSFLKSHGYDHFVFFTNRGTFHSSVDFPSTALLNQLVELSLARRCIDDFHFDVLAADAPLCERVAQRSLAALREHRRL